MDSLSDLERVHPAIPPSVLLKADLIFRGLQPDRALAAAGQGAMPHFRRLEIDGAVRPIPYFLHLPDGAGGELLALVRPDSASPFRLDAKAGG